jgi:hypothetical protein
MALTEELEPETIAQCHQRLVLTFADSHDRISPHLVTHSPRTHSPRQTHAPSLSQVAFITYEYGWSPEVVADGVVSIRHVK